MSALLLQGACTAQNITARDYNWVISNSDVIVVGNLIMEELSPAELLETDFRTFKVKPISFLKGSLNDESRVQIDVRTATSLGTPPSIQDGRTYILFLVKERSTGGFPGIVEQFERANSISVIEQAADKIVDTIASNDKSSKLQIVENWKGIIPVEPGATENRAIAAISKSYGINILHDIEAFKEAIAFVSSNKATTEISENAMKIVAAMNLKKLKQ